MTPEVESVGTVACVPAVVAVVPALVDVVVPLDTRGTVVVPEASVAVDESSSVVAVVVAAVVFVVVFAVVVAAAVVVALSSVVAAVVVCAIADVANKAKVDRSKHRFSDTYCPAIVVGTLDLRLATVTL